MNNLSDWKTAFFGIVLILAIFLLFPPAFSQTCTGGLAGTNLQDCTGSASSPCNNCDVTDMDFEIRAPDDTTTTNWQNMSYSTEVGTCSVTCTEETWISNYGYTFCPQEGTYDARTRAYTNNAWETSDWNIGVYSVNWDSSQNWCTCKTGSSANWFSTVSGGSNGNCCGDDGANDDFYYHSADPTTATSLNCTRCSDGTKYGPALLYGNGYWSGSSPTTDTLGTCYYGDMTCNSTTDSNGASGTYYGNGYVSGSTCYYGDITCSDGSASNGASCTLNTGGQCIADTGCLNAPTALQVTNKTDNNITISWTDNSSVEDGFRIDRSPDGSTWTEIATVGANITSYTNTGLSCNTLYYYRVKAYRGDVNSGYSAQVSAYTLTTVPTSVAVTADSNSQLTVTWSECANNSPENWIDETTGHSGGSDSASWQAPNSYTDTDLLANTQYCYRVKARNADLVETSYSSQACKYTLPGDPVPVSTSHTVNAWSSDTTIDFTCSGAAAIYHYVWNQSASTTVTTSDTSWDGSALTKTATSDGNWYLHVISANPDGATNAGGTIHLGPFKIDSTAPTTTDNAPTNWQTSNFSVNLSCSDGAGIGCQTTYYRVDSGSWQTGTVISITTDGNHRIDYYSVDGIGNTESTHTTYAPLDKTPPAISVSSPVENALIQSTAVFVDFTIDKDQGSSIVLSSIRVLLDSVDSSDFNRDTHCNESSGSYTCSFYVYVRLSRDYNLSIIGSDIAGHVSQVDRNFGVYTTYSLEGHTIEPSIPAHSSSYSVADFGLTNLGGGACSNSYCITTGFASIFRNIPPNLLYTGYDQGYFSGVLPIKFYASDYESEELHLKLAYSQLGGSFENTISSDSNLNDYNNITNLSCESTDWRYPRLCTYDWNTTGVDGNYYIDLNLWDIQGDSNTYSTQYSLCIDNSPPSIAISLPEKDSITSNPTISFKLTNTTCAPLALSSVQVKLNGSIIGFNPSDDCTALGNDYNCEFYATGLSEGDYNLSIIVPDLAGNIGQVDRNFHFSPLINVSSIQPSGTLETGIVTVPFTVYNTMLDTLYASLYYSSIAAGKLSFENAIDLNVELDEYALNSNLDCDSNTWWPPVQCTYTWNASTVADGNYVIDINIWNESGLQSQNSSKAYFLLDNTPPIASVTDVSSDWVYKDRVYIGCSDSGSGCKALKWYYFSPTTNCSTSKSDYNYSTTLDYLDITTDHNDYICLWVENMVGLHGTTVSSQLHVSNAAYVVSAAQSESEALATQDLNNSCNMYFGRVLTVSCDFKSTLKVSEWAKDLNRVWQNAPNLVVSPNRTVRVLLEKELEAFYNKDYFLKFKSKTRTITSKGDERNYPITVVKRQLVPLLTRAGQLEVGTLIIKIRQR